MRKPGKNCGSWMQRKPKTGDVQSIGARQFPECGIHSALVLSRDACGGMNPGIRELAENGPSPKPRLRAPTSWLIGVLTLLLAAASPARAQISSVTRRTLQTPPAITVFVSTNTVAVAPPVIVAAPQRTKEKTEAEKADEQQRIVAFLKLRAEAGKAAFQYDLGLRYLKGDGVEPDLELARKWIGAAAKQGHEQARKKLEELEKPPPPTR